MSNDFLSYRDPVAAVAVLESDLIGFRLASAGEVDMNEREAGRKVAAGIARAPEDRLLLLFYDSIKIPPENGSPPIMNSSTPSQPGSGKSWVMPSLSSVPGSWVITISTGPSSSAVHQWHRRASWASCWVGIFPSTIA
jgi:hypothetical protein